MNNIAFIDLEIDGRGKIVDAGAVKAVDFHARFPGGAEEAQIAHQRVFHAQFPQECKILFEFGHLAVMDPSMEQAIRTALGYDADHVLYTNDLWQITELEVPTEATTLEDLSYLTYLESLTVSGRNMSNLQDFESLTHLKKLNLSGCRFPAESLATIAELSSSYPIPSAYAAYLKALR